MSARSVRRRRLRGALIHPLEAAAVYAAYGLCAALPLDAASAIGGFIGRTIGPHLGLSRRAANRLRRVFPEKTESEIASILRGVWDNFGRVAAEYTHLDAIRTFGTDSRLEIVGLEHFDAARDSGRPVICFSAHFGNWEMALLAARQRGLPLNVIYRSANNRWVDKLIQRSRRDVVAGAIAKGREGAREAMTVLKSGEHLAVLVDQRMNDGIPVPFFGRPAMTAPALAQLALKYDCVVLPTRVERVAGARFRLTVFPALSPPIGEDRHAVVLAYMTKVNEIIESWVRARPDQWLWLHRRWPD